MSIGNIVCGIQQKLRNRHIIVFLKIEYLKLIQCYVNYISIIKKKQFSDEKIIQESYTSALSISNT